MRCLHSEDLGKEIAMSFIENGTIYAMRYSKSQGQIQSLSMSRYGQDISIPAVLNAARDGFQQWASRRGSELIKRLSPEERVNVPLQEKMAPRRPDVEEEQPLGIAIDDSELINIMLNSLQDQMDHPGAIAESLNQMGISVSPTQMFAIHKISDEWKEQGGGLSFEQCEEHLREAAEISDRPTLKPGHKRSPSHDDPQFTPPRPKG